MLRTAIPAYASSQGRCRPRHQERDGARRRNQNRTQNYVFPDLKQQEFNAVLIATGASDENGLDIEGHDLNGVMGCMEFLHQLDQSGKRPM